jgi:triacylglycerol lipase
MKPVRKPIPVDPPIEVQRKLLLEPESNPTGYVPFESAREFPFEPEAASHSRVNAWWLADASWLAYSHDPAAIAQVYRDRTGLECELVEARGAECTVAFGDRFAIVAFRGTQPDDWSDLLDDACFVAVPWDAGHVHQGFARRLTNISGGLQGVLARLPASCRLWFTGHSLGAAAATLAAFRHHARTDGVCTFGSPLVGNSVFAGTFGGLFDVRSTRYVNDHDLVTRVPPEPFALPHGLYTHVDHGRWINKDGHIGTTRPTVTQFVRDVFGRASVALDLIEMHQRGFGRSLPDALSDHTPLYYALHCWNDFAVHFPEPSPGPAGALE